jgi:hypothetical protein
MPYRLCFSAPAEGASFIFENLVTLYFLIDLLLNFFVGYTTPKGDLITKHDAVVRNYITGWFTIDFLASFPVDWISIAFSGGISSNAQAGRMLKMFRIFRFLKVVRALRVAKLKKVMDRLDQELEGSNGRILLFTIFKIIMFLFSIGHVSCCFWYSVGVSSQRTYGVSWLTEKLPDYDIAGLSENYVNYVWSFHYAMATMTTVGYGDISPTNTAEALYTFALLWVSLVIFSGCLGVLMNLLSRMYEEGQERRMRMNELSKYMHWRVIPRELRMNIRRYLTFVGDCNEKIGEAEVKLMESLSPTLRMSLSVYIFGNVLQSGAYNRAGGKSAVWYGPNNAHLISSLGGSFSALSKPILESK